MKSLGKTINLDIMPSGIRKAKLLNWSGVMYMIPRENRKDCGDLKWLNTPGVYFLFGKDDESEKQWIYVGEADNVGKRLWQRHTFEKKGDSYWTEAVIFVTPDGELEKGRVKYLENRFFTIATEVKRCIVKNGNTPPQSSMNDSIRDSLESFIINAKTVLHALGHMAFEPLPSSGKDEAEAKKERLYLKGKGVSAVGQITSDGFWVLKGTHIYPQVASYAPLGIKKAREKYATRIDKNGVLLEDICFGSPSFASTFVCGKNSNGLVDWKNKDGVSLKDLDSVEEVGTSSSPLKNAAKPVP